jgi:SAM-dependent methyltransferase
VSDATPTSVNAAEIGNWNAKTGLTWVQYQDQLDRLIAPLGDRAMAVLAPESGETILDIGCGCGQTTPDLAHRVTGTGAVTGVDVSGPMLEAARARPVDAGACRPEFLQYDAQTEDLGQGRFDAIYSRFGVMFFDDPTAAFANLARALKSKGRLAFVCWRLFQNNPWLRDPLVAASPFLPPRPMADPIAPGPFAFADADRVRKILADAGFEAVSVDPFDTSIGGLSVEETVDLASYVGPLAPILRDNPGLKPVVTEAVTQSTLRHATADGVMMPAAVWIVQARKP